MTARGAPRLNASLLSLQVRLGDVHELPDSKEHDVVALSDALSGLAAFDPRMSQVVELRFFGGRLSRISVDEPEPFVERLEGAGDLLPVRLRIRPPLTLEVEQRRHRCQY